MDDSERRGSKRSRFDQTEPEPKRTSRFDRRSRSPPARKSDSGRDRSPISRPHDPPTGPKSPVDPAAAAAAAAAKINAQLQARKGIQHVDVPPVRSASTGASKDGGPPPAINGEMYIADGDFIKDIEVNDLRNRYLLTKGSTQKMIKEETGADVTTRGSYYPDKAMATPSNPPLYLHVTSTTKEGLDKALAKIEELKKQELPQLVDERRFRRREEQAPVERDEYGRRKWPDMKIPIGLESVPGFNLRAQVVGHGGAYVKHIQSETGCRVQIKGRGSGYMEASTGRESDEDMYLHVAGPEQHMVDKATELCNDLLENVKQQYEEFKSRPPRQHYGGGGGGYNRDNHHNNNNNNNNSSSNSNHNSYRNSPAPAASSYASPPPAATTPTSATDYSAQYAQYYQAAGAGAGAAGADPYAAYGGYQAYMQMYQQCLNYACSRSVIPISLSDQRNHFDSTRCAIFQSTALAMSHQRYPSHDAAVKEPHSVSLKVLRLSRPSLVAQHPLPLPLSTTASHPLPPPIPASLAYSSSSPSEQNTNPDPFILSPILNLPPAFGSAYVGETFSCTLCANHDIPPPVDGGPPLSEKTIRDVKIEAEMKSPGSAGTLKLDLFPPSGSGVDLSPSETLQRILGFDLKEEGNHVLAVTVSYYEATEMSGKTRTFRKLYQFNCKPSLIVRTKASALTALDADTNEGKRRRWVLEAQLENCSEEGMMLERAELVTEDGLGWTDVNFWDGDGGAETESKKPVLKPGEVEQVCFVLTEEEAGKVKPEEYEEKRVIKLGILQVGWRREMGARGFLSTGMLGTRYFEPRGVVV
ncbi:putative kh domain-protein [Podospora australis]|uniref:Kh domain-protein n=1 Tax=Podospora australis TaxID=1536484 RepID=A0AAN6WR11_9PEZI|nr:putative kh domain-protein [Podospora australis]